MSLPKIIRHAGKLYRKASFVDVGEFLVTAAPPRSEAEWKQFAQELYAFYEDQLDSLSRLDEAGALLNAVSADIGKLTSLYQKAQSTSDIRVLRELMNMGNVLLYRDMRSLIPALKDQYTKLLEVKKAKKAHDKLKKQVARIQKDRMKKWFK